MSEEDLVYHLRKRAEIRRQIPTSKSVQWDLPDQEPLGSEFEEVLQKNLDSLYEITDASR